MEWTNYGWGTGGRTIISLSLAKPSSRVREAADVQKMTDHFPFPWRFYFNNMSWLPLDENRLYAEEKDA